MLEGSTGRGPQRAWVGDALSSGGREVPCPGMPWWDWLPGSPDASLAGGYKPGTGQGRVGSPLPAAPAHSPACSGWTLHISRGFGPELGVGVALTSPQACLGCLSTILREAGRGRKGVRGTLRPPGLLCQGWWGRGGCAQGAPCSHPVLTPPPRRCGGRAGRQRVSKSAPMSPPSRGARPKCTSSPCPGGAPTGTDSLFLLLPLWGWGSPVLGATPLAQGPLCPLAPGATPTRGRAALGHSPQPLRHAKALPFSTRGSRQGPRGSPRSNAADTQRRRALARALRRDRCGRPGHRRLRWPRRT